MKKISLAYLLYFVIVFAFYTVHQLQLASCRKFLGPCLFGLGWAVFPYALACAIGYQKSNKKLFIGVSLNVLVLLIDLVLTYLFLHPSEPDAQGALALLLIPFPQYLIIGIYLIALDK